jgi:Polyketide cyclase / dehydrase and lipid transport
MRLESSVMIRRAPEEVWSFLEDISNVPKWDRGVAAVRVTSSSPAAIGSEFDTLPYPRHEGDDLEWGRMSYRVTEWDRVGRSCAVKLINSTGNARFFRTAAWLTRVEPAPQGSRVVSCVDFALRLRYAFLAPVLYAKRHAILTDLQCLRRVLEAS